jgi:chromosome segregation ATPase
MDIKKFADIVTLRGTALGEIEKRGDQIAKKLPQRPQDLLELKREEIKRTKSAVKDAERARDANLKRANADIVHLQGSLAGLEREADELESELKKKPTKPARPPK